MSAVFTAYYTRFRQSKAGEGIEIPLIAFAIASLAAVLLAAPHFLQNQARQDAVAIATGAAHGLEELASAENTDQEAMALFLFKDAKAFAHLSLGSSNACLKAVAGVVDGLAVPGAGDPLLFEKADRVRGALEACD